MLYCSSIDCFQFLPCALHSFQPPSDVLQTTKLHSLSMSLGAETINVRMRLKKESKDGELWACLWGSSAIAAEILMSGGGDLLRGLSVLELGCGTGLVSVGAVYAGAQSVLLTDCVAEALPLALCNAYDAAATSESNDRATEIRARTLNFNTECPTELVEGFDLVCGADVVYIGRVVSAVLNLAWKALRPGGFLLITDPGRGYTEDLASRAEDMGFEVLIQQDLRGIPTSVCHMGACSIVVCLKPTLTHNCAFEDIKACLTTIEHCCVRISNRSKVPQKGERCDYILRTQTDS